MINKLRSLKGIINYLVIFIVLFSISYTVLSINVYAQIPSQVCLGACATGPADAQPPPTIQIPTTPLNGASTALMPAVSASTSPCQPVTVHSNTINESKQQHRRRRPGRSGNRGLIQFLIQFLQKLMQLIQQLLGSGNTSPTPAVPSPIPVTTAPVSNPPSNAPVTQAPISPSPSMGVTLPPCPANTPIVQPSQPQISPLISAQISPSIPMPSGGGTPIPSTGRCAAAGGNIITVNPGSSIQQAASSAQAGSIVCVMPGTYDERLTISNSGSSGSPIKIISDTLYGAKIFPTGTHSGNLIEISGSYITLDGFEVATAPGGHDQSGVDSSGNNNIVSHNKIHDINTSGSDVGSCSGMGGTGNVFDGNLVYHCGHSTLDNGIYSYEGSNNKIINNVVGNTAGFGIHLWHTPNTILIYNNTSFNNHEGGITIGNGESTTTATGCVVANNITYNNGVAGGIQEAGNVSGNKYINNFSPDGIHLINGTQTGSITSGDPMFVNYQADGTGDYHLQPGSPAIGKADATYAPATNAESLNRTAPPNIGAY